MLSGASPLPETHASTTDPDARLYRKGRGKEAKLSFMGHALMENRNGLIVGALATRASGHAERLAALHLMEPHADRAGRVTLGADKGYDAQDFVAELREVNVTPHVAQNMSGRRSAIDGRTTHHPGWSLIQGRPREAELRALRGQRPDAVGCCRRHGCGGARIGFRRLHAPS